GVIVDPHTPSRGGEEIDMMAERKPAAAEAAAEIGEQVGKAGRILDPHDVERERACGVHHRHGDPWRRRPQSPSQATGTAPRQGRETCTLSTGGPTATEITAGRGERSAPMVRGAQTISTKFQR